MKNFILGLFVCDLFCRNKDVIVQSLNKALDKAEQRKAQQDQPATVPSDPNLG